MKFIKKSLAIKKGSLVKNVFGVFIFNIVSAVLSFLLNIFLARYFDVETYGKISYFTASFLVFYTIFEFGYGNTLVILKNKIDVNYKRHFNNYLNLHFLVFNILMLIIFQFSYKILIKIFDFNIFEIRILILTSFFFSFYSYIISIYQADGNWIKYNYLNLLNNLTKVIILLTVILFCLNILKIKFTFELFIKTYLIYVLVLLFITIAFSYNNINFNRQKYKVQLYNTLIPLGITNIIVIFAMRIDNFIIVNYLDNFSLGIYSAANSFALIFPIITGSLMKVLLKESSRLGIEYLKKILEFQKKYYIYLIIFILLVIISSKYLIILFFGTRYIQSIPIFQVLSIVYIGGIFFTPLESYFFSYNQKLIMFIKMIQLFIITILGIIFVKLLGILGMAISIVLSRLFAWFFFTLKTKKIIFEKDDVF